MKHIHFIGICGVGMSALAILWKEKGWMVTGSDAGFYPPISTHLEENGVHFYAGWHPEKMCSGGNPDLVVVGNVAGSENPEWSYVQKHNLARVSYPELIAQNLVRANSIVCAGTWGKTSTTALLAYVLKTANFRPAYMFGGLSKSLPHSADDEGGDWSVLEGDEYKTGKYNSEAKFFSYKPTHLLLTGLSWDHFDMYPTEQSYYDAFSKLLSGIPDDGLLVACVDNDNISRVIGAAKCKIVKYGTKDSDYKYGGVRMDKDGVHLKIMHNGTEYNIGSPMLGTYMAENICGAFAMATEIGVPADLIVGAIGKFEGIKRRLEKRGVTKNGTAVFDDIAHSPVKARPILKTLREIYPGKIIAIFEPNTGNRQVSSVASYAGGFKDADEVLIPRLTKIKIDESMTQEAMDGAALRAVIAESHSNVRLMADDDALVAYLKTAAGPDDAIVFLGSHGFRGMIEDLLV